MATKSPKVRTDPQETLQGAGRKPLKPEPVECRRQVMLLTATKPTLQS